MGLMGTLAKVAIGYAAARGVDHLSKSGGMGGLMGGAHVPAGQARAAQNPLVSQMQGMMGGADGANPLDNVQAMMAGLMGGAGGANAADKIQEMMSGMMGGAGNMQEMMQSLLGGGAPQSGSGGSGGGLLSGGGGAGLAGLMAMAGGAAAASGTGTRAMIDAFHPAETAPEAEAAAGLMLRAMIQAAKADSGIDAQEQAKIMEMVEDGDAEDIAFVRDQLAAPVDVDGLAAATPEMQKMQVYSMSLMTIRVDTEAEAQYLDQLAGALGLDQQTVNALHLQMGVQPLYT